MNSIQQLRPFAPVLAVVPIAGFVFGAFLQALVG
jgi:hypothetical protein